MPLRLRAVLIVANGAGRTAKRCAPSDRLQVRSNVERAFNEAVKMLKCGKGGRFLGCEAAQRAAERLAAQTARLPLTVSE